MLTRPVLVIAAMIVALPTFAQSQDGWIADRRSGCKVSNRNTAPNESVTWSGNCVNGIAQGPGTLQWFRDGKFIVKHEGTMHDGRMSGLVKYTFPSGSRLECNVTGDGCNGHGVFYSANGDRYDGEWRDGRPNGYGTVVQNGHAFAGPWSKGCFKQGEATFWLFTTKEACGFK